MASLEKRYSGGILTRVSIGTQALSWSNRLLPPPSHQSTELHPASGHSPCHSLVKRDWASAKDMPTLRAHVQRDHCLHVCGVAENMYIMVSLQTLEMLVYQA